jgi:hypothetical protein
LTPNRRPGARGASKKEHGKYWYDMAARPHRAAVGSVGWPAGRGWVLSAKDQTDDPAELHVLCALLMAFDGTCEREGVQRAPQEIG